MSSNSTEIIVVAPNLRDELQRFVGQFSESEMEEATLLSAVLTDRGLGEQFRLGTRLFLGGDTDSRTLRDLAVRVVRLVFNGSVWQALLTEEQRMVVAATQSDDANWHKWASSMGLELWQAPRHFFVNEPGYGFLVDQVTANRIAALAASGKALDIDVPEPAVHLYPAYEDQLSLEPSEEVRATWREWLGYHEVNPDDHADVERFFREYPDEDSPWFSDEDGMQCPYMDTDSETFVMPDLDADVDDEMLTNSDGEILPEVCEKLPSVQVVEVVDVEGLAEPIGNMGEPLGEISLGEVSGPGGSATGVSLSGEAAASGLQLRLLELGHRIKIHY